MEKKVERVLELYVRLLEGKLIQKGICALRYEVTPRTIQRDIDDIRCYLSLHGEADEAVLYDREKEGFYLGREKSRHSRW